MGQPDGIGYGPPAVDVMHAMSWFNVAGAYLLGSIPFGFLLVLWVRKEDIRQSGSGNIGATNVLRSGAKGLGALTFLLDASKGYAAVLLARYFTSNPNPAALRDAAIVAGFFAIVGHVFPVWLRFKGGKGVATAFGVFLAVSPWAALGALGIFAAVFALSRYVSLASIIAAVALPFLALLLGPPHPSVLFRVLVFCCPALVIAKHRGNIWRLAKGVEYRFGKPRPTEA
jgi:glycerol-3-phosphate acyltransferase PlsY